MKSKKRHTCIYCGKKRIETRMRIVPAPLVEVDNHRIQGNAWACFFKTFLRPEIDHYRAYLERRRGYFHQMGDKCQSALDKAGKVPQVNRNN